MSTLLTVNVTNNSPYQQSFYFFQQPAIYTGGYSVYSNSLWASYLGPSATTGGQLTFMANVQFYAGVQQAVSLVPQVGQISGSALASQPINLATTGKTTNDGTTMSVSPLGLAVPTYMNGVQPGAFRIVTPSYNPNVTPYNAGSATQANGLIVLSSFVVAPPNQNIDCQPIMKYYVAVGQYTPGTVMNFSQSSVGSALCDFTGGFTSARVIYNADGTWSVQSS